MTLLEELKERRTATGAEMDRLEAEGREIDRKWKDQERLFDDLCAAILALDPTDADDLEDDDEKPVEQITVLCGDAIIEGEPQGFAPTVTAEPQDDASEFSEEGYAPVVEAEPLADPIWNEPEPTKPEADSIAKAHDYYDPKAMADRERFNPFNIFKREGDQ